MSKRLFDLVSATILAIVLSPFLLAVALAVWLTDGRPILFRQVRVGKDGRDFRIFKFRTMSVLKEAEQGSFDAGGGRRITRVGRFLRKTKLDELPQVWNVIRGDLSLVGPRPEVRSWVEAYPQRWAVVHTIRPGITDPASILYRNEEEILAASADPEKTYRNEVLPKKLDLYEDYVHNHTFLGDLRILIRTVKAVLLR